MVCAVTALIPGTSVRSTPKIRPLYRRSFAHISPTPFDSGRLPPFGQPVLKEDLFDAGARAIVQVGGLDGEDAHQGITGVAFDWPRSEERRVGKEGRSRWSPYH